MMYWFPRAEFTREGLFRQKVKGSHTKHSSDVDGFEKLAEGMLGFEFDAHKQITDHLGKEPMSVSVPTSNPLPVTSGSTAPSNQSFPLGLSSIAGS